MEKVTHTFEPVYDQNSRILILGTFPSVKSRENRFYYASPEPVLEGDGGSAGGIGPGDDRGKEGHAPCRAYRGLGCDRLL